MRLLHLIMQELKQGKEAFRRFPLSMGFAVLAAIFQCLWLHKDDATAFKTSPYLLAVLCVIGFFLTTAAYLYLETARDRENFHSLLVGTWMGVLLFLVISTFRLASMRKEGVDIYFAMPTLILFAVSGLMVFCGGKIRDERRFPAYVLIMIMEIAVSYLYAFVLFAAMCGHFIRLGRFFHVDYLPRHHLLYALYGDDFSLAPQRRGRRPQPLRCGDPRDQQFV